jgi:outer membrane protein assembly factor BamB
MMWVFGVWACMVSGSLAAGVLTPLGQATDWPCWRGPDRSGLSRETGLNWQWDTNSLPVHWKASVGKGFSSFAVADGRAYTMGNSDNADTVWCFDAEKGSVLWKHSYACELQPLSYEGGPGSTPAVANGRVYTFSKGGDLFCLDAADGRVVWAKKFDPWPRLEGDWKNTWRYAGSPLVVGDRLYMSLGQAGMALTAKEGSMVWRSDAGHPGYSSPVPFRAGAKAALAFFSGHAVIGADAQTGKRLWEIPWHTEWDFNAADPIIDDGKLFVSSGNNAGCALYDLAAYPPRELWRNKNLKTPLCGAVLWQGHLYGFNDADLSCVEWSTGTLKWSERSLRRGSLLVAEGRLVALSENGTLAVAPATPEGYKPILAARVLTGRCWTSPALARGRLYLRNAQGDVVCYDVRAR